MFAIAGADGWTLIDTGLAGSPKRIQAALAALAVEPPALARIYLTHHHFDHIGGLPGMRAWAPDAEILAPEHEAGIIAWKQRMDSSSNRVVGLIQGLSKLSVVP